jgi:hypothetical protein
MTWNRVSAHRKPALIEAAGLVFGTDQELAKLARQQVVATLGLGCVAGLLVTSSPSMTTVLAAIPMVMLGWKGPLIIVRSREKKRRTEVDLELVDALGEMVMGVEAGLTLDVVMMRYASARSTPLAEEFRNVLDRIQLGTPRADSDSADVFDCADPESTFGNPACRSPPSASDDRSATASTGCRGKSGEGPNENDFPDSVLHPSRAHDCCRGSSDYSIDPCSALNARNSRPEVGVEGVQVNRLLDL